jgi:cytochrome P450
MDIPETHANAAPLYGPRYSENPIAAYRALRLEYGDVAPILLEGDVPAWLVLAFREAQFVLGNPDLFPSDGRHWNLWDQIPQDWPLRIIAAWSPALRFTEGAELERRTGAISDVLTAVDATELARTCERAAEHLIDVFHPAGTADLTVQYALPLAVGVLAYHYGLRGDGLSALVDDILNASEQRSEAAFRNAATRIAGLVGQIRDTQGGGSQVPGGQRPGGQRPGRQGTGKPAAGTQGGGLAARLAAHPAGLTNEELVIDLTLMLAMASRAVSDWIANTLRRMLGDDRFALIVDGGSVGVGQALTEVLWTDSPTQNLMGRWAAWDCDLAGRRIRKGDLLVIGLQAANADPLVRPASFSDVSVSRAHLAFGHGEHACPFGAPEIAEIIARTAVETLLDRLPDIALTLPAGILPWRDMVWTRSLLSLPVAFEPVSTTEPATR